MTDAIPVGQTEALHVRQASEDCPSLGEEVRGEGQTAEATAVSQTSGNGSDPFDHDAHFPIPHPHPPVHAEELGEVIEIQFVKGRITAALMDSDGRWVAIEFTEGDVLRIGPKRPEFHL